jgi:hypothetical protein
METKRNISYCETLLLVVTRLTYHVHKAHDLCEAHIYCQHYSGELKNQASINQQRIRIAMQ